MNTETKNLLPDSLEQRLQHDAESICVNVDDNFSQRISNRLHPHVTNTTRSPRTRPWLGWGLATAAALALVIIVGHEILTSGNMPVDQPLVANLELNLDKALASREDDLHSELLKVQNDLQRVESMLGLGGETFSK